MEDPLRENIDGSKRVVHSVEHRINWGYVAAAVVALFVLAKLSPILSSREERDDLDGGEEW